MAGDWLKMECSTPEKPEVLAVTAKLGWEDPDLTVGKLFRMWRWFDQHTVDGNAAGVTPALLDRILGVTGFALAASVAGWLLVTEQGLTLPNFDRHNGSTAKQRALTAKRVHKHKGSGKGNDEGNAGAVSTGVSGSLPREEKKREEKKESKDNPRARVVLAERPADIAEPLWNDFLAIRHKKRAPLTVTAFDGIVEQANLAGWPIAKALKECCERGWSGFKASWVGEQNSGANRPGRESLAAQTERDMAVAARMRERELLEEQGGHPGIAP